jgi:undecaprenyl-diphosphatase
VDYLIAVILAIVEGFTEFLPISSTGHLIIAEAFLKLGDDPAFARAFFVVIQFPAILSVVVYFWAVLWPFRRLNTEGASRLGRLPIAWDARTMLLWCKVATAFLPAAVLGLLFNDFIEGYLLYPLPVGIMLIVGGVVLIIIERRNAGGRMASVHEIGFTTAALIGCFQCIAMVPGTSRSAATIIGGMLLGLKRPAAAEFSFFLAIPTMLGAFVLSLAKHGLGFTAHQWALLMVGSVVSFLVAYASIAFLMRYIQRHDFSAFGWYRIVVGTAVLVLIYVGYLT